MSISSTGQLVLRFTHLAIEAARLPVAHLHFERRLDPQHIATAYANFTRRHPRLKLVRNKTLGMALVDLHRFRIRDDYIATVKRKDYAAHHGRRARARGYTLHEIDRNDFIDDIHRIHTSHAARQDASCVDRPTRGGPRAHFKYFGMFNRDGDLMAYCNTVTLGNFAAIDRVLGYRNNDGMMHLLLMEIICRFIDEGRLHYFMYDTFLGTQEGLRNFKKRLGFQPYRVRYSMS